LLQVCNHALAWIAVCAEEGMVVADAVQALSDILVGKTTTGVSVRESLDGTLLVLDVFLDFTSRTAFRVNLLRGNRYEVISKKVKGIVLFKHRVDSLDRLNTGEGEQILHLRSL
jgi:hypothetical protein